MSDLLDYTRVRAPSRTAISVRNLVNLAFTWVPVPDNVSITGNWDNQTTEVLVDQDQVGRGFANIMSNAIQAITGKGYLRIDAGADGGYVWVRFEDNGCGITPDNMKKLFEPLFTTKPKGIGLGLAISRRLVEQNSGDIQVESEPDKGTVFTVRLPILEEVRDERARQCVSCR